MPSTRAWNSLSLPSPYSCYVLLCLTNFLIFLIGVSWMMFNNIWSKKYRIPYFHIQKFFTLVWNLGYTVNWQLYIHRISFCYSRHFCKANCLVLETKMCVIVLQTTFAKSDESSLGFLRDKVSETKWKGHPMHTGLNFYLEITSLSYSGAFTC